jgi:hypothetical protein
MHPDPFVEMQHRRTAATVACENLDQAIDVVRRLAW